MKTKQLFVAVLLCASATSYSQGFYFGLGGGYGFPAAKQTFFTDSKTTTTGSSTTYEESSHPISLGKGVISGLYAGYAFNKNVGAEIGFSYLVGSKYTFTNENINTVSNVNSKDEEHWHGRMMRLIPSLRIMAGEKKMRPYVKAGFIVGFGGKMYQDVTRTNSSPGSSSITEESWEYSGGMCSGFHGALGLNFMVNEKVGIYAELAGNYQSYAPAKGLMTKYTVDGQDQMSSLDRRDKEVEFSYDYSETYSGGASPDPNSPDVGTRFYLPFSSLGINVGLHLSFGKSE